MTTVTVSASRRNAAHVSAKHQAPSNRRPSKSSRKPAGGVPTNGGALAPPRSPVLVLRHKLTTASVAALRESSFPELRGSLWAHRGPVRPGLTTSSTLVRHRHRRRTPRGAALEVRSPPRNARPCGPRRVALLARARRAAREAVQQPGGKPQRVSLGNAAARTACRLPSAPGWGKGSRAVASDSAHGERPDPRQPRLRGAPLDHRENHPPLHRPSRQPAPRRVHALEERRLRFLELSRFDVVVKSRGSPVVGRHVVPLPPFS